MISTNNYIYFVIIKTQKPGDCNLGPTSYRWTFRNLHNRVGIGEETESGSKFSEKQNFEQNFWAENF